MEVPEKRKLSPSNFPCYPAAETDDLLGEPHSARSVINGSQSQALQSRRWRWRRSWALYLALFLYLTLPAVTASDNDWSLNCPEACTCKWIHGKKTAECRSAGFNSIPTDLSDEVQVLDLTGNIISTLTKDIFKQAGLLHLQRIFLKNCQIERIDRDAFRELRILIELDLSENKIRTLQMEGFETNTRLRELQLNDNPLNKLSGVEFPPLLFLSKLGLKNCQLSEFSKKSFANLVNLVELDLSGNKFRYISEELLQPLKKLKSLDLRDNPWRCDCRLKSFREWASANKLLQAGTKCAEPGPVANFEWNILLSSNFACSPEIINLQVNGQPTEVAIVGDVGKEITLECLVRANPPADVRWVRDNVAVTNATASAQGKAYYVHISGDLERWVNLTIQNSHPGDGGEYTCVGENKGGSVEKNVTLNFQEVPSGAGVGTGMGNDPNGYHSRSWLWILISGLVGGAILILVILLVCFYSRRRRTNKSTRSLDLKGLQQQQQPLVDHDSSGGRSTPGQVAKEGSTPLLTDSKYPVTSTEGEGGDPDYPDLLDLPNRPQESPAGSTASTVIMPQQLNPAALYDPSRNTLNFAYPTHHHHPHLYQHGMGRPHSPYSGSVASFASEPPQVIVPSRPGYVTLPRRPRVPSWSPATHSHHPSISTPLSTSPTGSSVMSPYVKYDNMGPRTTADGSSRLSLNKLDGMNGTPGPHYPQHSATLPHRSPALRSTPIPSHHIPGPHFNFDPIQENDGPTPPSDNFPSNYGLPMPSTEDPLQTLPRSWRPTEPAQPRHSTPEPRSQSVSTPPPSGSAKKVPPKPPPKPVKKPTQSSTEEPATAVKGDDGTEV